MARARVHPTFSYHALTVPVFRRGLGNLRGMLVTAESHCEKAGINEAELLATRLAPDMFPLVRQVQMAGGMATYVTTTLANRPPFSLPDTETCLGELQLRLDRIDDYLAQMREAEIGDRTSERYTLPPLGGTSVTLPAERFVTEFALPNFYFHLNMSYALLRTAGVPLGKSDYIGELTSE